MNLPTEGDNGLSVSLIKIDSKSVMFFQAVVSLVFAASLLFPNFSAKWGLIDDYEIIAFIGNQSSLRFQEIPKILLTRTEVGLPGSKLARYRPAYYLIKLIEAATWGKNPFFWYSFRILLFGISIFIAWRLLQRFFGIVIGGLSCLILLSHSFWADIWSRLGPGEIYCVIGVALYCFGFVNLWEKRASEKNTLSWLSLTFGALLAMGSKENFLLLLPITAVLVYRVWRQHRLNALPFILNLLLFCFGTFISVAVILSLKNLGTDVYSNPVSPMNRYQILKSGVFSPSQWKIQLPLWLSLFAFGASSVFHFKFYKSNRMATEVFEEAKCLLIIELLLILLWYSQFVFYNGAWPAENRYDFPGVPARDLMYIFLAYFPIRCLNRNQTYLRLRIISQIMHTGLIGVLVFFFMQFGFRELKIVNHACIVNSETTQKFTKSLSLIVEEVRGNTHTPIIFEIYDVWDYEPVHGMRSYLFNSGVKNHLFLKLENWSEKNFRPGIETVLATELQGLSEKGDKSEEFYPIQTIQQGSNCFVISFSGDSNLPCKNLGRIWD